MVEFTQFEGSYSGLRTICYDQTYWYAFLLLSMMTLIRGLLTIASFQSFTINNNDQNTIR